MSHKIISHSFSVSGGNVTVDFTIEDSQEPPSHYNLNYIIRAQTANVLMPTGISFIVAGKWRTSISLTYAGRTELTGVFKIARFGVWSETYKASNETEPVFSPAEYYPTYYPTVKHQWIWNFSTSSYNLGQADNCVAHAITTLKEIHERREGKGTNFYSINWVYGNRASSHNQGEGMYTNEALERLQSQGVPLFSDMLDHNTIYPDNRHYADVGGLKGAKRIYQDSYANTTIRGKASQQKITSFTEYIHKSANATAIKQAIIADGGVLVDFAIATNFDNVFWSLNDGIIPEHPDSLTGVWHTMVIIGWKKINNKTYWICHNNWGNWADNGVCYVPLDYVCFSRYFKVVDWSSPKWTRWTTKVKQGEDFNITAQDWNDYIDFIKAAYTRNGWSIPTMTYVSSGQDFLATRFNEVKNAIGTRVGTGIANRSKDDDILASYFHTMENSSNQL